MATIPGTSSNDTLTGAAGPDTAVIDSVSAFASFDLDYQGRWTVKSTQGTDTLVGIENVEFKDGSIALAAAGSGRLDNYGAYYPSASPGPSLATFADGSYVVGIASEKYVNNTYVTQLQVVRYSATGQALGGAILLNPVELARGTWPTVATLGDGGFVAVAHLRDSVTNQFRLIAQRYDAQGNKVGGDIVVAGSESASGAVVSVTAMAKGGFLVAFDTWVRDQPNPLPKVVAIGATGVQTALNVLPEVQGIGGKLNVDVAKGANGEYFALYAAGTDTNGPKIVHLQIFNGDGTQKGQPIPVGGTTSDPSYYFAASLQNGGHVVSWIEGRNIMVRYYDAAGAAGEMVSVSRLTDIYQSFDIPVVTPLRDGGYLVSWTILAQGGNAVYGQRFDPNGVKVGPELLLAIGVTSKVEVAATPDGFDVSWANGSIYVARFEDGHATANLSTIAGDAGANTLVFTGTAAVKLDGGAGNDTLTGGSGADVLDGGAGADKLTGGAGNDTYVADVLDTIVEAADGGTDTVQIAATYTLDRNLENAWLRGAGSYNLTGNGVDNYLIGNSGANVLNGGAGNDTMEGGSGDDTYIVDRSGDVVREEQGGGTDSVTSSATYTLSDNVENLRLSGSRNIDGTGNALDNRIVGNEANNVLDGKAGNDLLIGGGGDDTYIVDAADTVQEEADGGVDRVQSSVGTTLDDNLENLVLTGNAHIAGTGNELANNIAGNAGNNVLNGMGGIDTVDGGEGSDTIWVDDAADIAVDSGRSGTDTVKASVSYGIGNGIENLILMGTLAIDGTGNGGNNQITGNGANNVLAGGGGSDRLVGGAGNDTLYAGAIGETFSNGGNDELVGGTGNDTYYLGSDTVTVTERAGEGVDTVYASVGATYTLGANVENLVLVGLDIDAAGNGLANDITGTTAANVLDGAAGADTLRGLDGDDTYIVDNAGDKVIEAALGGVDKVISTVGYTLGAELEHLQLAGAAAIAGTGNALNNRITGNRAANVLGGGAGNDTIVGGGGADTIGGGDGNDVIYATGTENIDGGLGTDIVSYAGATANMTVDLALTVAQNTVGTASQTLTGIEYLAAGAGNDTVRGNELSNRLQGNAGDDVLDGRDGNDMLEGGIGQDTLTGGLGNDRLSGGSGVDSASYVDATAGVTVNLVLLTAQDTVGAGIDTLDGIENLFGSSTGNDTLTGDAEDNILRGYGGNDRLEGGEGDNLLDGHDGNDVFVADQGNDIVEGGAGIDLVDYGAAQASVAVMLASGTRDNAAGPASTMGTARGGGNDTLYDIENVNGSRFDDLIVGSDGANVLNGLGGADRMMGEGGNDTYYVDNAGDIVVEAIAGATGGIDTVNATVSFVLGANVENLRLTAATAIDGTGNASNNTIVGGAGANVLAGGAGKDTLTGGAGKDMFVFNTALSTAANVDTITDFSAADDTIQLENAIFARLGAAGALNAGYLRLGTAAADANDYIVYDGATGTLSYDADGSGAGIAIQVAVLTGRPALTILDFAVI